MKRLALFLVAAVFMLSSCTTEESEVIYMISHGVESQSLQKVSPSASATLIEEFIQAEIALDNQYESDFEWKSWVKGGKYSSADKDALSKFASICSAYDAFYQEWTSKFAACTDTSSTFKEVTHLKLDRISSESKTLKSKTYEVKLNL